MGQFQNCLGEGVWSLLGKVVTRALHLVMPAGPGEVTGRRAAVSGRKIAICQAVQGDSRDRDGRLRSKLLLNLVVRNPQREEPTKPRTNAAISSAAVSKAK